MNSLLTQSIKLKDFIVPVGKEEIHNSKFRATAYLRLFFILPILFGFYGYRKANGNGHFRKNTSDR